MEWFSNFVIKNRKLIGVFFVIVTLISLYLDQFVVLNYDFSKYIPDEEPSIAAYNKVEEEFGMSGTARIMFKDVTLAEAAEYNAIIENVDGVDMVMWLDDTVDVYRPIEFIDPEVLNEYYKNGDTVMDIMFEEDDYSEKTYNAIHELQDMFPDDGTVLFMGSAVTNTSVRDSVKSEMVVILSIMIPIVIIILLLTTDSWISPIIFLVVIGVSILINKGTNVMFDSISYITYSISAALQLAISMDYSVFILHQFSHEREKGLDPETAMRYTLRDGITSVIASATTTIAGFIALSFMDFGLGRDLGLVFSKGIILSLICVIFLMPYLILTFYDKIEKTRHKSLLPSFEKFARVVIKYKVIFVVVALAVTIPMFVAQNSNDFLYGAAAVGAGEGTQVYEDEKVITDEFGRTEFMLVLVPTSSYVDQKALADELEDIKVADKDGNMQNIIRYAKTVANTLPVGVPDFFAPQDVLEKFKNENYVRVLISARTDSESELAFETLDKIKEVCNKYYPDNYYLTGTIPVNVDMKTVIEKDYSRVNMLSIIAVMVILLFTFKSLALPVLLVAVIESAIFVNMGIPYLREESMIFVGYLIVSTIQLGATIDYAILMTDNYLAYKETMKKKDAIIAALNKSLPSLVTSGGILITCGYAIKGASSLTAIADIGELIGRGAIFSLTFVTLVLPQVLYIFDGLIVKTTLQDEYKLRIGNKVFVLGRKAENQNRRIKLIKDANKKILQGINKRIKKKLEKLEEYKVKRNERNVERLNKVIKELEGLKENIEKESEEIEDNIQQNEASKITTKKKIKNNL